MKRILITTALILVLYTSGCTVPYLNIEIPFLPDIFPGMQVKEQTHDIIAIESLQAIPSASVRSGQSVRLRAVVKNLQKPEYEKIQVKIILFNDCGLFYDVKTEFCSGSQTSIEDPGAGVSGCITTMYPQSTALVEWRLITKDVNVETTCNVGILAQYNYKTYSTGSVTFVNKAELERLVSEGKSFSETGIATIGEGPVKPYIEVLSQPIVIDTDPGNQDPGSGIMSLYIENKGSGLLDISESGAREGNLVFGCDNFDQSNLLMQTGVQQTKQMCLDITGGLKGEFAGMTEEKIIAKKGESKMTIKQCIQEHLKTPEGKYSVSFIGKKTPKYSCSVTASNIDEIKQEKTYQITAEVGYSYKFTKEIALTVSPKIQL
jgi:hypothetical protein